MSSSANIPNRPVGYLDSQGRVIPDSFNDIAFQGEYTGTNLIYKGHSRPGSSTASAVWQIAKLSYDGSNNLLTIKWPEDANGHASNDYAFVWDNRATYTYV